MSLSSSVEDFPLFEKREEKERFLLTLGLLASRSITLAKAAELAGMSRTSFSALLRGVGFRYSYLDTDEASEELDTSKEVAGKKPH
jgi:predicted HTH domain antitoxin